jgi:hypothetical protein
MKTPWSLGSKILQKIDCDGKKITIMFSRTRNGIVIVYLLVSVHLAERFQRRRLKCEKLTDDGRHVMAKVHIAFGKVS